MSAPSVTYNSITINGVSVLLNGTCKGSFNSPYNLITVNMSTDISLSQYKVMITPDGDEYDINEGVQACFMSNIAANKTTTYTIDINETNFPNGDGDYRVSLYAQSSLDGTWDVTYLFMTVSNGNLFIPKDSDALETSVETEIYEG